jgi:hypothetical protein
MTGEQYKEMGEIKDRSGMKKSMEDVLIEILGFLTLIHITLIRIKRQQISSNDA